MKSVSVRHLSLTLLIIFMTLFMATLVNASAMESTNRARTLYVKMSGSGDCSDWANACYLTTALSEATSGDTIWVASGYYEPHPTNRTASFNLKSGVYIYGGFPLDGGDWTDRDWNRNFTILEGDINTLGQFQDNSFHVVYSESVNNAILDGFYIEGGYADGTGELDNYGAGLFMVFSSDVILRNLYFMQNSAIGGSGGGMYVWNSSPTLENVIFENNTAKSGGGMSNENSSPTLTEVTFSTNIALEWGGGMHNYSGSNPTLTDVTFTGNSVTGSESVTTCYGGGMSITGASTSTLTDVTFTDNISAFDGGGLYSTDGSNTTLTGVSFAGNSAANHGGAMYKNNSDAILTTVSLINNTTSINGGGLYNSGTGKTELNDVTFTTNTASDSGGGMFTSSNNPVLIDVVFSGNEALTNDGGGIYSTSSDQTLTNVSFINNQAGSHGGGFFNFSGNPSLANVTFNSNSAGIGGGMNNHMNSEPTLVNVTFSGNQAGYYGGAIFNSQGSTPSLTNVTIFQNTAGEYGGAIYSFYSCETTIINSIVWGNLPQADQIIDSYESTSNISYSDIEGGWAAGEYNININPRLGPLADNGGLTQTHALLYKSPAIDSGSTDICPENDQRGESRPFDGDDDGKAVCDMGSFEVHEILISFYIPLLMK